MKDIESTGPRMDFAHAIAPVTPEVFFDEYFEKKHLVVRRDDADYYRDLLSIADIDRVLTQTIVPSTDMNMVKVGVHVDKDNITMPSGNIDPVRVAQHFADGATAVLPQLHRRLPKLAAYCRAMETVFSCDLQTNIYLTPADAQGFKTHYDSHDVIVLQTHGSKTWNIYESPMALPQRSQSFDPDTFVAGKLIDTFVLHAGDMCYVPRGVVHDAIATDEVSLHITTGLLATRWVDLLIEAVAELANTELGLRESLPPGYANEGFDKTEAVAQFQALMTLAAEKIDASEALDGYAAQFRRRRQPTVPGQFLAHLTADAIEIGTQVQRRDDLIYRILMVPGEDGAEEITLDIYGTEVAFPAYAEATLRDAMTREGPFRVGDLDGDIDDAGQAVLVRRLVREGVLYAL